MTVIALAMFAALAAAAILLARHRLSFISFACALLAAVPLLFAAQQPGAALAWIAVVGPIVALGVVLDADRNFI